jgi:4-amino-4-deoxy-L-arabinose transferase-like glycosyltransferase
MLVIPLLAFLAILTFFKANQSSWRAAMMSAAVIWAVLLTVITEGLSLFERLTFWWLVGSWAVVTLVVTTATWRWRTRESLVTQASTTRPPLAEKIIIAGLTAVIGMVGVIALVASPNSGDAMTYHLPRVMHWIQNQTVAHYPTTIERQLYSSPWAEFAVLNFQLLGHGDRFVNLVQWISLLGSTLGVSLLTKQFGGSSRAQILAAVACATLPVGILQGSSAKNEFVVAFWLVALVHHLLNAKTNRGWSASLLAGLSLGLAILTKPTAYIYAFPFVAAFARSEFLRVRTGAIKPLISIGVAALALNIGHYSRNIALYGTPLGAVEDPRGMYALLNEVFTPASLFSNVTRNITLHAATPIDGINAMTERGVVYLHKLLAMDVSDPRTTWFGKVFKVSKLSSHESDVGNPLHLALICLAIAILCLRRSGENEREVLQHSVLVGCAFLLFCAYLKWQPFHTRLHLPIFVLLSPCIGMAISKFGTRVFTMVAATLILGGLPWIVANKSRPLLGRESILTTTRTYQYFMNAPELRQPYADAALFVRSQACRRVGLVLDWDDPEYPLWVLLGDSMSKHDLHLQHMFVTTPSASKASDNPFNAFSPCAIIQSQSRRTTAGELDVNAWQNADFGPIRVLTPRSRRHAGE